MKKKTSHEKFWLIVAEYYRQDISEVIMRLYAEDVRRFTVDELNGAFEVYRKNPRHEFMPKPAQLIAILKPNDTPEDVAASLAQKLYGAVGSKGYTWAWDSDFYAQLEANMGSLAVSVIQNRGGWQRFCYDCDQSSSPENFKAQLRNEIAATMRMAKNGTLGKPVALPEPHNVRKFAAGIGRSLPTNNTEEK